jgi:hypothetical protein
MRSQCGSPVPRMLLRMHLRNQSHNKNLVQCIRNIAQCNKNNAKVTRDDIYSRHAQKPMFNCELKTCHENIIKIITLCNRIGPGAIRESSSSMFYSIGVWRSILSHYNINIHNNITPACFRKDKSPSSRYIVSSPELKT